MEDIFKTLRFNLDKAKLWYDSVLSRKKPDEDVVNLRNLDSIENKNEVFSTIIKEIPDYFKQYKLDKNVILDQYLHVDKRTFSTAKHILQYISKCNYSEDKITLIKKYLSKAGQEWKKPSEVNCFILTKPEAFVSLGQFPIDKTSCMNHRGQNYHHKYCLADKDGSFVGIIKKGELDKSKLEGTNILARFVGIVDYDKQTICFFNEYKNQINIPYQTMADFISKKYFNKPAIKTTIANPFVIKGGINYMHEPHVFNSKDSYMAEFPFWNLKNG